MPVRLGCGQAMATPRGRTMVCSSRCAKRQWRARRRRERREQVTPVAGSISFRVGVTRGFAGAACKQTTYRQRESSQGGGQAGVDRPRSRLDRLEARARRRGRFHSVPNRVKGHAMTLALLPLGLERWLQANRRAALAGCVDGASPKTFRRRPAVLRRSSPPAGLSAGAAQAGVRVRAPDGWPLDE